MLHYGTEQLIELKADDVNSLIRTDQKFSPHQRISLLFKVKQHQKFIQFWAKRHILFKVWGECILSGGLKGWSESHTLLSNVVDVTVLADEWISENPWWSESKVIEGKGSEDAGVSHSNVDDVVYWFNGIDIASDGDIKSSFSGGTWKIVGLIITVVLKI